MPDSIDDQIAALVNQPAESMAVELKTWIDPRTPEGKNKIVRGTFALRNHNGGFILIGFNDGTATPDPYRLGDAVEDVFHVDEIQSVISRYASQPFPVDVHLRERAGQRHPVIAVPPGVRVPVVVKSDLPGGPGQQNLLSRGDLFFRTLRSNNTVSSAKIQPDDYPELMELCFNNREADIGGFLRRQLGQSDILALATTVRALLGIDVDLLEEPTLKDEAFSLIEDGDQRFLLAVQARGVTESERAALSRLTLHVGLIIRPQKPDEVPTQAFLDTLARANPQYTGWPIWLDSRNFTDSRSRPQVVAEAWQALIVSVGSSWSDHLDFMRLDPRGKFYLRRALQDDMTKEVPAGSSLDVMLMIYRVAEVFAVGLSFARAAGWSDDSIAGFAFQWTGLRNRQLNSWANPLIFVGNATGQSTDDEAKSFVNIGIGTPHTSLAPYVSQAIKPLFSAFHGYEAPAPLVEACVKRMVERAMIS